MLNLLKWHSDVPGLWHCQGNRCVSESISIGAFELSFDPMGGVLVGDNFKRAEGSSRRASFMVCIGKCDYSVGMRAMRQRHMFAGWWTKPYGGVQVYGANGKCMAGSFWSEDGKWQYRGNLRLFAHWQEGNCIDIQIGAVSGSYVYTILWYGKGGPSHCRFSSSEPWLLVNRTEARQVNSLWMLEVYYAVLANEGEAARSAMISGVIDGGDVTLHIDQASELLNSRLYLDKG